MSTCQQDIAIRFISDRLNADEASEFELHLETCTACRERLEALASSTEMWQTTSDLLSRSGELPEWRAAVDLQTSTAQEIHQTIDASCLTHLLPTDDPNSLGRIGLYEVTGVIGRGGTGIVYKAFDRMLNRFVAIKMLDASLSGVSAARSRFAREARAMAAICHEHVVPIYAVEEQQGLQYFAMEYVPGGTMEARLEREGPLDPLSIIRISLQIASALKAAHECGLVHRDIKPANILLDRGIERVRVADFGMARVADDASHTRSGFVAGTPQYMSPEQVRGETCDWRSDLFSLGCVMYAMCVGHSPFRAESIYGIMQRIVHDRPRWIIDQNPGIPEWLEQFIFRLLEKDASKRFDSTGQVVEILTAELQYAQCGHSAVLPMRTWFRNSRNDRRKLRFATMGILILSTLFLYGIWNQFFTTPRQMESHEKDKSGEHSKGDGESPHSIGPTFEDLEKLQRKLESRLQQSDRERAIDRPDPAALEAEQREKQKQNSKTESPN